MRDKLFILAFAIAFALGLLYVIKVTRPPVEVDNVVPSSFGERTMEYDIGGVSERAQ